MLLRTQDKTFGFLHPSEDESSEKDVGFGATKNMATRTSTTTTRQRQDKMVDLVSRPVRNIVVPQSHDVLIGLSKSARQRNHSGNTLFRVELKKRVAFNLRCSLEKPVEVLAAETVREWRNKSPPGRFLKLDSKSRKYYDVGDIYAQDKAAKQIKTLLAAAIAAAAVDDPVHRLRSYSDGTTCSASFRSLFTTSHSGRAPSPFLAAGSSVSLTLFLNGCYGIIQLYASATEELCQTTWDMYTEQCNEQYNNKELGIFFLDCTAIATVHCPCDLASSVRGCSSLVSVQLPDPLIRQAGGPLAFDGRSTFKTQTLLNDDDRSTTVYEYLFVGCSLVLQSTVVARFTWASLPPHQRHQPPQLRGYIIVPSLKKSRFL